MKTSAIAVALILTVLNLAGQPIIFKTDVVSAAFQTYNISLEHQLKNKRTLQWTLFTTNYSGGGSLFNGWGLSPEYRLYMGQRPDPSGFYVAPSLRVQEFWITDNYKQKSNHLSYGGALVAGFQFVFGKAIVDAFLGPSFTINAITRPVSSGKDATVILGSGSFSKSSLEGLGLRAGVQIGIGCKHN